jgi:hypothetical protein
MAQPRDVRGRYARRPRQAPAWWFLLLFFGGIAVLLIVAS